MSSENKKILGIVNELLSNSLYAEGKEINISISKNPDSTLIKIEDNGKGMDEDTLKSVRRTLSQPKRKDMQSYYDGLVGHSSLGSGLNLVGLLSSESEVESSDKGTKIIIKLKLEGKKLKA